MVMEWDTPCWPDIPTFHLPLPSPGGRALGAQDFILFQVSLHFSEQHNTLPCPGRDKQASLKAFTFLISVTKRTPDAMHTWVRVGVMGPWMGWHCLQAVGPLFSPSLQSLGGVAKSPWLGRMPPGSRRTISVPVMLLT